MAKTNTPATQNFVSVSDIRGNVVLLKDGQMCMVLLASSINFALKSTDEQQAVLQQFQAMLNTLDFSIQIYVQSRKLNIVPYLTLLTGLEKVQDNDLMRIQLREYIEFIRSFTDEVNVMSKNFFIIIPYTPAKINIQGGIEKILAGSNAKKTQNVTKNMTEEEFNEHRHQLEQRVAIVEQGLNRVGVRTIPLQKDELVEFYYHIFNPNDITGSAPTSSATNEPQPN
ncbi:hypothetical protein KC723_00145 [Candidatus Kaiserbacteria bacterium]|nr:hypothetical protein [Candidatus Kaiserbacteria bacterium]